MFGLNWEHLDGKVIAAAVHKTHASGDGLWYKRMKYVVEYQLPGTPAVRVELKEPEKFGAKVISTLAAGAKAPLLFDPKSGEVRFDVDDQRINLKATMARSKRRDDDDFRKALKG